jgi:hypothetical protein
MFSFENAFRPSAPKPLFRTRIELDPGLRNIAAREYDVTPDGKRYLLNERLLESTDAPITVVVNWTKLLAK